jgi:hypothetical protein
MSRKDILQKLLDTSMKDMITKMFGKKSYIKINNISYVRSKNCHSINATVYVDDIENHVEFFPEGSSLIIKQAWSVVGDKKPIIVNFSLDVPE